MTETEARQALLVRAYESPITAPWTQADADRCGSEALRIEGTAAAPERTIARRAQLAIDTLAQRHTPVRQALDATASHRGAGWLMIVLAAAFGMAADGLGGSRTINLLAPPLLALLAWNLIVYLVLLIAAARGRRPAGRVRQVVGSGLAKVFRRWQSMGSAGSAAHRAPALERFVADWAREAAPLHRARVAAWLHGAALALAAGVLASMYLRGLAFEYRAGWESTFLSPESVHTLLGWVLGPASALTGLALPGATELESLRFSNGGGENAARWIHWHAVTIALFVLLPRGVLAVVAALRARQLERRFPLALTDPYHARLVRDATGGLVVAHVLPYSYRASDAARAGLQRWLRERLGASTHAAVMDTLSAGAEDQLPALLGQLPTQAPDHRLVALFALTATPERETHVAFVDALARYAAPGTGVLVVIDESTWRERFGTDTSGARLAQRHDAWRRALQTIAAEPQFVDLAAFTAAGAAG